MIKGVEKLNPVEFVLDGDRICAGTYLAAALAVGGDILVKGVDPAQLREPILTMRHMGARVTIEEEEKSIRLLMRGCD